MLDQVQSERRVPVTSPGEGLALLNPANCFPPYIHTARTKFVLKGEVVPAEGGRPA